MKTTKFDSTFSKDEITDSLSGLASGSAYSFTKKDNEKEFNQVLSLIPAKGYTEKKEIESIDLIYSGSGGIYQISLMVGREDRFKGKECYDFDHFNFAPLSGSTEYYFLNQHHHTETPDGKRFSFEINPYTIPCDIDRKNLLYSTFLTGSLTSCSFAEYDAIKSDFFKIHKNCFEEKS